jgi:hypothetical protein
MDSQPTVKMRVSLDGKFLGAIDLPKECIGNASKIFELIKTQRPKEIKKLDHLLGKVDQTSTGRSIALKDKPVVNFITEE